MAKNKTKTLKPTIASDKSQKGVVLSWNLIIFKTCHTHNCKNNHMSKAITWPTIGTCSINIWKKS